MKRGKITTGNEIYRERETIDIDKKVQRKRYMIDTWKRRNESNQQSEMKKREIKKERVKNREKKWEREKRN